MNIIKQLNKLNKLSKKNDTLGFVRKSIEIDLEKISNTNSFTKLFNKTGIDSWIHSTTWVFARQLKDRAFHAWKASLSTCPWGNRGGACPMPLTRAIGFGRNGEREPMVVSRPAYSKRAWLYPTHSLSLPGGLVVSNRIKFWRSSSGLGGYVVEALTFGSAKMISLGSISRR